MNYAQNKLQKQLIFSSNLKILTETPPLKRCNK